MKWALARAMFHDPKEGNGCSIVDLECLDRMSGFNNSGDCRMCVIALAFILKHPEVIGEKEAP